MGVRCYGAYGMGSDLGYLAAEDDSFVATSPRLEACVRIDKAPATSQEYALISKGGLDTTRRANYYLGYGFSGGGSPQYTIGFVTSGGTVHSLVISASELTVGRW